MSLKPGFTRWILRRSDSLSNRYQIGTCCVEPGDCREQKIKEQCDDLSGTWYEEQSCSEISPACDPVGSCCVEDPVGTFTCFGEGDGYTNESVTESACCLGLPFCGSNTWTENGTCPDPDCSATGACCDPGENCSEDCSDVHEYECDPSEFQVYKGDGTTCLDDPAPCLVLGICCLNGACTVTTECDCDGTWHEDTSCDSYDCRTDPCTSVISTSRCCIDWDCHDEDGSCIAFCREYADCVCDCPADTSCIDCQIACDNGTIDCDAGDDVDCVDGGGVDCPPSC